MSEWRFNIQVRGKEELFLCSLVRECLPIGKALVRIYILEDGCAVSPVLVGLYG